jgi:hypothetical protein
MSVLRTFAASTALALTTFAVAACGESATPTQPAALAAQKAPAAHAHQGAVTGTTGGWENGREVTFFYNRPFECTQPPASGASSGCALGAEATVAPRGGPIPVVYVMVPLGFRPAESTLQCPEVGNCINHPSTMDLSRVFGPGTENALLPAHSHVIGEENGNKNPSAGWWEIEVVGVPSQAAWDRVVAGKSLAAVRTLQQEGAVTGDIPTNLFLFFGVRR